MRSDGSMNRSIPVIFDKDKCDAPAEELFLESSGCGREGEKYERMRREAFSVREAIGPGTGPRGVYSVYPGFSLKGRTLETGGVLLSCSAFEQIPEDAVEGVIVYAVTAGDYDMPEGTVMEQLYADIWGTAYTDAARNLLTDELRAEYMLSDSFGPGFYGMDLEEMKKLPGLVDFAAAGISVNESGTLYPEKSCAGILFAVNKKYRPVDGACMFCAGNESSCALCRQR